MTDKKLTDRQHSYWSNKADKIQPNLSYNYSIFKSVVIDGKKEICGFSYEDFDVSACVDRINELEQELKKCLNKLGWTGKNQLHNYFWKRNAEYRAELKSALINWEHKEEG